MKKQSTEAEIKQYIEFLEKALASKNFKNNDPEKYAQYEGKLDKERLKLKLLYNK